MIYRKPESIKTRLDLMEKKIGKANIIIDHGVASYSYSRYEYIEPSFKNNWTSSISIYVYDFDKDNTEILYMTVTENDLRKPNKDDWYVELVHCSWDKEYPSVLYMREYTAK